MSITDDRGNKLPQPKNSKREKSRNNRILAAEKSKIENAQGIQNNHCPQCGFCVRGNGHFLAAHHNQ